MPSFASSLGRVQAPAEAESLMTIPDFGKRLTTARGRVEHNNPGPGVRTSIGPQERAEIIRRTYGPKTDLTSESNSDTIPEATVEFHAQEVPATLPEHSGSVLRVVPMTTDNPSPASPEPQRDGDRPLPVVNGDAQPTSGDTTDV